MKRENAKDPLREFVGGRIGVRYTNAKVFLREVETKQMDGETYYITILGAMCVTKNPLVGYTKKSPFSEKQVPQEELWLGGLSLEPDKKYFGGPCYGHTINQVFTDGGFNQNDSKWELYWPEVEAVKKRLREVNKKEE